MLHHTWIQQRGDIEALRPQWEELVEHSPTNTIFQSLDWHLAWLEAFNAQYQPVFLTTWYNDSLVALAPFVHSEQRIFGRTLQTYSLAGSANYASDYADILYRDTHTLSSLLDYALTRPPWKCLELRNIPSTSPTIQAFNNHFSNWNHSWWDTTLRIDTPARIIGDTKADQKIIKKQLFKRKLKALQKQGTVAFTLHEDKDEILNLLPHLFELHQKRWNNTATPSQFNDPKQKDFYTRFISHLLPSGSIHCSTLTLDGQPIALHLGFRDAKKFYWYKPIFDTAYSEYSPGMLLFKELFQVMIEDGCKEFDFTVGQESYKYQFANTIRTNSTVRATTDPLLAHIFRIKDGLRQFLKSTS